jgi:hypothetical protein
LKPGSSTPIFGSPQGSPNFLYFYHHDASVPNQTPFFEGYIRDSYVVEVNPSTSSVTAITQTLSERDLVKFKALHPDDEKIQAVTLAQLQEHYKKRHFKGNNAESLPSEPVNRGDTTECAIAAAVVALDILFLYTGAVALKEKINDSSIHRAAQLLQPVLSEIELSFQMLSSEGATVIEKMYAAKNILHVLWSGSLIEPIYKAAMNSLTWWDMVLYGTLGMAAIAGGFLTDGAATVALLVAEFATAAFFVTDAKKAYTVCILN